MSPRFASAIMNWSGYLASYVFYCFVEYGESFGSKAFKKSKVGFVGHAVGGCGVDNGFVESQYTLGRASLEAFGQFFHVGVEAHA